MDPNAEPGYADMADEIELMQRAGVFVRNARRLRLHNVEIAGQSGPAIRLIDATDVELSAVSTRTPAAETPVIQLTNIDTAFVHGCRAQSETDVFLSVEGEATQEIALRGNHLARARKPVVIALDVSTDAISEK